MEPLAARIGGMRRWFRHNGASLLFWTLIGLICIFLVAPIAVVIVTAFNPARYVTFPPRGFTLNWFFEIWNNRDILGSEQELFPQTR